MLIAIVVNADAVKEKTVFITHLCLAPMELGAKPPLKLGHYIHKKIVPIIENKSDSLVVFEVFASITLFLGEVN